MKELLIERLDGVFELRSKRTEIFNSANAAG